MDLDTMERRLRRLEDEFKKFEPMLTQALLGWLDDHLAREMDRVAELDAKADEDERTRAAERAYETEGNAEAPPVPKQPEPEPTPTNAPAPAAPPV